VGIAHLSLSVGRIEGMVQQKRLFTFLIGLLLVALLVPTVGSQTSCQQTILEDLATANIVYLGENHDSQADHEAQLMIAQRLQSQNPRLAIAFEMFQRPYQVYLDQYRSGMISETELRQKTEYDERWGFNWEFYAPILRFARQKNLPLIALNTPTEITRKVAREGLESLSTSEMSYIPPKAEIKTDNEAYRQMMLAAYQQHTGGTSQGFDRFFLAQVLWDETMAEAIVQFHQANPNYLILVLAGKGHIVYGYGIPSRVRRRLPDRAIGRSVLFGDDETLWKEGKAQPADYDWCASP
jgi:uncharacterized iron-regulated protein